MKKRHKKLAGFHPMDACELCLKNIKSLRAPEVAIDHERYEFVTDAEAAQRGDSVSLFRVGPDCERRIRRALAATP